MLDTAMSVIVGAAERIDLAETLYGQAYARHWHKIAGLATAWDATSEHAAGSRCAEAIEAIVQRSPPRITRLLRAIAAIDVPADPRQLQLLAAAKAIAANQPPTALR